MIKTFKHALRGIASAFQSERNMKIHVVMALMVLAQVYFFRIPRDEWVILVILIGLVISAEMMNTAIEKLADLIHPGIDERVRFIKDVAAGAVLVLSIAAAVIGIGILLPYWTTLLAQ
ncbi:MAG: diacylglycerol kinase family protein [Bacteroidia bacterium]|nr:diacylglycerol kinase family protein [Bacteroidia bacterium]